MEKKEVIEVIGTGVVFALLVAALGFVVAQYTGIGGGLAGLAPPFSPIKNELAYNYAVLGGGIGFVLGGVAGYYRGRKPETAKPGSDPKPSQ